VDIKSPLRAPARAALRIRDRVRARRAERAATARDRRILRSLAGRSDLRINVGSSSLHLDDWVSTDLRRDLEGRCIRMDATEPWPFESNSAIAVNSEHFIEHVAVEHARAYLREAFRVLQPAGVIRTSTPDLQGLCEIYLERDRELLELHREHGYTATGFGDLVNNYFYLWDHRHIYDLEKLTELLREAGFERVERARFGESSHEVLRGIDRHEVGALERSVLTVDAVKP
jgi:predicted SAM-dependent methyltransferase